MLIAILVKGACSFACTIAQEAAGSAANAMKKLLLTVILACLPAFALADQSCLKLDGTGIDPNGGGAKQIEQTYKEKQDPVSDLMGCAAEVTQGGMGASEVKGTCGCKQAVQKLCKYNTKKQKVKASGGADKAWCAVFAPWAL